MKTGPLLLRVGELLEWSGRLYSVAGVHLGALNQESIVEIVPLDHTRPEQHGQTCHPLVPYHILQDGYRLGILTILP